MEGFGDAFAHLAHKLGVSRVDPSGQAGVSGGSPACDGRDGSFEPDARAHDPRRQPHDCPALNHIALGVVVALCACAPTTERDPPKEAVSDPPPRAPEVRRRYRAPEPVACSTLAPPQLPGYEFRVHGVRWHFPLAVPAAATAEPGGGVYGLREVRDVAWGAGEPGEGKSRSCDRERGDGRGVGRAGVMAVFGGGGHVPGVMQTSASLFATRHRG